MINRAFFHVHHIWMVYVTQSLQHGRLLPGSCAFLFLPPAFQEMGRGAWMFLAALLVANGIVLFFFYRRLVFLKNKLARMEQQQGRDVLPAHAQAVPKEVKPNGATTLGKTNGEERHRLLLIESDPARMAELAGCLSGNFQVAAFQHAGEALGSALQAVPDVIVVGLDLSDISGLEVCEMLKINCLTGHVPILAIGEGNGFDESQALQRGADTCIHTFSPDPAELVAKVNKLIQSKELLRHKFRPGLNKKPIGEVAGYNQIFLDRLHQVIDRHLNDEGFSTIQLSAEMGMSRTQLHRKVTELLNQPAGEYIKNYRLDKAYLMLQDGGRQVQEVMEKVGYAKMSYFSEQFKKKHGITPNRLKKRPGDGP